MCANFAMHLKNVRSSSSPHPAPTSLLRRDGRLRRTIGRIGTGAEIVGPNDEPVGWSFRWSISDFSTLRIHADTVVSHTSRRHFPPRRTTSSVPVNIVTAECPLECPSYGFEQILLFSRVPGNTRLYKYRTPHVVSGPIRLNRPGRNWRRSGREFPIDYLRSRLRVRTARVLSNNTSAKEIDLDRSSRPDENVFGQS